MVNFYLDKILNNIVNINTGVAWTIDDIPKLWKSKVQKQLEQQISK